MNQGQFPLGLVTVHCFWARCPHVVTAADPGRAHDLMEAHYDADHQADIARLAPPAR